MSPAQSVRAAVLALGLVGGAGACGGVQRNYGARGCTTNHGELTIELTQGITIQQPPPCSYFQGVYISSNIELTALRDGLTLRFNVTDSEFAPGAWHLPSGARDAVVLFPHGEGAGQPTLEVQTEAAPGGYRIDELVPWAALSPDPLQGRFVLHLVLFDRARNGTETELRLVVRVRLHGVTLTPARA